MLTVGRNGILQHEPEQARTSRDPYYSSPASLLLFTIPAPDLGKSQLLEY